jgi:prevent-host-death family protein
MKSLPVGELKANFSEVLEEVQNGETIEIVYGRKKKPVARLVPVPYKKPRGKRKLGLLAGKMKVVFADDFKMTEEEFINLGK